MNDEKFDETFEEFVTQRIDDLGSDIPDAYADSMTEVGSCMARLKPVVPKEHAILFDELEDAIMSQVGEGTRYFYRSGFADATRFFFKALNINMPDSGAEGSV